MMAEIFLNALVIVYSIYQTAVAFGWTLLLFDIYNEFNEETGCPESPGIRGRIVHKLSQSFSWQFC